MDLLIYDLFLLIKANTFFFIYISKNENADKDNVKA